MITNLTGKTVDLNLVGLDGNAFAILGTWRRAAQRQGWTPAEITLVIDEATKGDYDHLLQVIIVHLTDGGRGSKGPRFELVAPAGFEPATMEFRGPCSAAELRGYT